jgi:anti-sigma factor RsiW
MKRIDDDIIQRYIDGETNLLEAEQIEKHIADCSLCANKIEEERAFISAIKSDLQNLTSPLVDIPCWAAVQPPSDYQRQVEPAEIERRRWNLRRTSFKHIVYAVSAACVAICVLFFALPERDEDHNFLMVYSVIEDFDANRTFSQQEKRIFIIDGDGKIVEFY